MVLSRCQMRASDLKITELKCITGLCLDPTSGLQGLGDSVTSHSLSLSLIATKTQLLAEYREASGERRKRQRQKSTAQSGAAACEAVPTSVSRHKSGGFESHSQLQMVESV